MAVRSGTSYRNRFAPPFSQRLTRGVCLFLLAAALFCLEPAPKVSAASATLEYDVKAAFLLNFTKFVEWPTSTFSASEAPLTICILGDDPFGRAIDQIVEGESVNGHKIAVERIRTDQQKSCQVVYARAYGTIPPTFSALGSAVLTVGEGDEFIHQGGVIGFVLDNRHVRFDINLKAAANAGLKLSSKLLSVAKSVER
jgi:hypothetical protein